MFSATIDSLCTGTGPTSAMAFPGVPRWTGTALAPPEGELTVGVLVGHGLQHYKEATRPKGDIEA